VDASDEERYRVMEAGFLAAEREIRHLKVELAKAVGS
jgi:hypothetical protein